MKIISDQPYPFTYLREAIHTVMPRICARRLFDFLSCKMGAYSRMGANSKGAYNHRYNFKSNSQMIDTIMLRISARALIKFSKLLGGRLFEVGRLFEGGRLFEDERLFEGRLCNCFCFTSNTKL